MAAPITVYGKDPDVWVTKDRRAIPIAELDDQHLCNIIVMLACLYPNDLFNIPQWSALRMEAVHRGLDICGLRGGVVDA